MGRRILTLALAAMLLAPVAAVAQGIGSVELVPSDETSYAPDEVIVRYRPGARGAARAAARAAAGARGAAALPVADTEVIHLEEGTSVADAVRTLTKRADVAWVQPNYRYRIAATPNDTHYSKQWGLHNTGQPHQSNPGGTPDADIDAPEAWDVTTGDKRIVVAVVDTGVDRAHEDLTGNLWSNGGETADGVDNDGNGKVDDVYGWDWVDDDNDPSDEHGHGTHVAGTIGARANNSKGVAGVAWNVSLMPLRVLDASGTGYTSDIAAGFAYAGEMGAHVVNASLGSSFNDQAVQDAITGSPGTLFVVAAGNDGTNNDSTPTYPCSSTASNLVCVAATDDDDTLASFSNYGATSVDLAAPGVSIASTYTTPPCVTAYCYSSGTSMATPHVAGAAALFLGVQPEASVSTVRAALLDRGDAVAALGSVTVTGKRLNLARALGGLSTAPARGFLRVTESGGTDTYTVRLRSAPTATVTVSIGVTGLLQVASPAGDLTFTTGDWATGQTVTIASTAPDNAVDDGPRSGTITHTVSSADGIYDGLAVPVLHVAITDHGDVSPANGSSFNDVGPAHVHIDDISWLSAAGITSGCHVELYCPSKDITRGQMAAFLTRALALPATSRDFFRDDNASVFEDDINRLAAAGITSGCSTFKFCASDKVTRGQMAAFLNRALGLAATLQDFFTDDNASVFEDDINRLAASGITSGCAASAYCPGANVTRAQMAAFLRRGLG